MPSLDRLFSLAYWLEASPGPLQPTSLAFHLWLAGLFGLGLVASREAWRRRLSPALLCALGLVACMSGLGGVALRLTAMPICAARIFVGAPLVLASGLVAAHAWLPQWALLRSNWQALWSFRPPASQLAPAAALALLAAHLLALMATARLLGWTSLTGPAMLAALLVPQLPACLRRGQSPPSVVGLNALLPGYLLVGLEAGRRVAQHSGWAPASWGAFPVGPVLAILACYAWAYQVFVDRPPTRRATLSWAPALQVSAGTLGWATWAYLSLYARGVTASDPYCYVQMAVDLARHGTLLHRFPFLQLARQLQVDPLPLLHVGYRRPPTAGIWAPTVWPTGHSVLLGLAGRLAGEQAIYLATPLMGLISVVVVIWLGHALFDDLEPPLGWLAGALAGLLVATSFEQLRWLLVHMADISAQLFSSLAVALALVAATRRRLVCAAAAGLALALAYWARHTQLAMALPVLAVLALSGASQGRRERLQAGVVCLAAALVGALPDLAYHHSVFGSPLHPESEELALYTARAVPVTTALLLRGWLGASEFGWLAPFLAAGGLALYRDNRRAAAVLGLWVAGLWAVQAPYAALRLRDLLPALPALALLAAYGAAKVVGQLASRERRGAVLLTLGLAGLLWLRTARTVALPHRRDVNNFGFLWATQRQEFAGLQDHTEPNAAIGSTLNSGAIDLYAQRAAFRPAAWREDERRRFLQALWDAGRPTYLLADGVAMEDVVADARRFSRVTPAHTLRLIPWYTLDAGSELRDVTLYRIEPPTGRSAAD